MRRFIAGGLLSAAMLVGASPLVGAAHANAAPTDPTLCFVAGQAILTEALNQYHAGSITIGDLRSVLVGTAAFIGDCLTPVESSLPPIVIPPVSTPTIPSVPVIPSLPNLPTFPSVNLPVVNIPSPN